MRILGIETSCDETSAAIVDDGRVVRSNIIASQTDLHAITGGVVPEVASREHLEQINAVIDAAVAAAGATLESIDAIAVTNRPGLVGALLVGVSAAKALGFSLNKPVYPIHHIEAHICANWLAGTPPQWPFVCLVASGGHTQLFLGTEPGVYRTIGRTRDDAAGEAFDKCARLLDLPYPGGVSIDALALRGDPTAVSLPRANLGSGSWDFSFSGLKTSVQNKLAGSQHTGIRKEDWAASIQAAIVDALVGTTVAAAEAAGVATLAIAGGVAANSGLRASLTEACNRRGMRLCIPPAQYCTDNAAMIACAASFHADRPPDAGLDFDTLPGAALG